MHLKAGALMMTLLMVLSLSACGGQVQQPSPETEVLQSYARLTGYSGKAAVTADYGDLVYQFQVSLSGTPEGGELTVTAPENIAGTGFSWSKGEGVSTYEGVSLETGALSVDGLSPADAMPVILDALSRGKELSCCEEQVEDVDAFAIVLTNPNLPEGEETINVWLDSQNGTLLRAEIACDGTTVITFAFSSFTYTYTQEETEG